MTKIADRVAPFFTPVTPWPEVQRALAAVGFDDGLPFAPPTAAGFAAMLKGADPSRDWGLMPPMFGRLTTGAVAYLCLLAGCPVGAMPAVLTAAVATLDPAFNLLGIQTTTGSAAVTMVLHGAQVGGLAANAAGNALGPGNRANATLGRALALTLRLVGGADPGVGDMATLGQPAKYGLCFAESEAAILPPCTERAGLPAGRDAVSVLGIAGTVEVLPGGDRTPEDTLAPMAGVLAGLRRGTDSGRARSPDRPDTILLPPEIAERLVAAGWGLATIADFFADRAGIAVRPIVTGGPGIKMACLPAWSGGTQPILAANLSP